MNTSDLQARAFRIWNNICNLTPMTMNESRYEKWMDGIKDMFDTLPEDFVKFIKLLRSKDDPLEWWTELTAMWGDSKFLWDVVALANHWEEINKAIETTITNNYTRGFIHDTSYETIRKCVHGVWLMAQRPDEVKEFVRLNE